MDTNTIIFLTELIFGLIVGWILSWSVGILPALIYRYLIYKKPIEKKKVFGRLAPIITILMFAYKITMSILTNTNPNPNPVPWIIIYYIGKWIMTRNYISNQQVGGIINWDEDETTKVDDSSVSSSKKYSEILPSEIICPNCKVILELEYEERILKKVICPNCKYEIIY